MAKLNVRNRNAGKVDKDGRAKKANWEYRFEAASVDKKRKQISKAGFRTKVDAERAGAAAMAEYNNAGLSFSPSEVSVADYLDYWVNNYCKTNVADSTANAYRNIIRKHLKPRIGHYRLKAVNTLILQEVINEIYLYRGFTKSYVKNILKVIKGAFRYAKVTAKLIPDNPAADVTLPNLAPDEDSEKEEVVVLSKENVNRILERFKNNKAIYYSCMTAYYTGCRVGEVFGLCRDDIDFERKQIRINKICKKIEVNGKASDGGVVRGTRGKTTTRWYLGACKTPSSYRTIDVGDTLLNALREYIEWQDRNKEEYGDLYTRHYLREEMTENNRKVKRIIPMTGVDFEVPMEEAKLLFVKEDGSFRGSDTPRYASKVIRHEMQIPDYTFHAFRHTHATMLIEAGTPIKAVSQRLGHGNVRTTMETYVHVTESMRTDAVDKFESIGDLSSSAKIVSFSDAKRKMDTVAK